MQTRVQFFAQLREIVGSGELVIELTSGGTVADLLAHLYRIYPALEKWDRNLLVGAGLEFVGRDHIVQPNDSIAIMPPVQGG